jgi:hypothetical protein
LNLRLVVDTSSAVLVLSNRKIVGASTTVIAKGCILNPTTRWDGGDSQRPPPDEE